MSDKEFSVDDREWYEADVGELVKILEKLPPGSRVFCNQVRNLTVVDSSGDQVGHINVRRHNTSYEQWGEYQ